MDPQIKRRLKTDVTIYPFLQRVDGDREFGESFVLKGYVVPKQGVITTREGTQVDIKTSILFAGEDLAKLNPDSDIYVPFIGRNPIRRIIPYPGIYTDYEIIEVLI